MDAEIQAAAEWFDRRYGGQEPIVTVVVERADVKRERRSRIVSIVLVLVALFGVGAALFAVGAVMKSVPVFIIGLTLMVAGFMWFGFKVARSGS